MTREALGRHLDGFIDGADLSGDLAVLALRSRRLAAAEATAEAERVVEADAMREARIRLKLAERLVEDLTLADRRFTQGQELDAILVSLAKRAGNGTSPPSCGG